eukprot:scaffold25148_cov72-Cyclotella_meneghiniana.AAC.1
MSVSVILSCFARVQAVIRCIYMKHLYQSDLRNKSASWSRCCILVVRSLMPPQMMTSLRGAIQQAVGVFLLGSLRKSSRFAIRKGLNELRNNVSKNELDLIVV